jgi:hypothetical protein
MDHPDPVPDSPLRASHSSISSRAGRGAMMGATVLLSGFIFFEAPVLWSEWQELRREWEVDRVGRPIGFVGISPNPSFAQPPSPWYHEEAGSLLLWSGWEEGKGHRWFRIGRGDLDASQLSQPFGRDVIRAIDRTIVETSGGKLWGLMHPETPVIPLEMGGVMLAYPLLVLEKVEAVNDTVGGRPVLVLHTPFVPQDRSVDLFDPVLDGRTLTFGLSGYLRMQDSHPVLYDRQSESLWSIRDRELVCLGGTMKGAALRGLGHAVPVSWSQWVGTHPGGRLVVGAERPEPPAPMHQARAPGRSRAQVPL